MTGYGKHRVSKSVIVYEIIGIILIILLLWINEVFDTPHMLLGAEPSPINWRESLFESICILIFGVAIVTGTYRLLQRMKYLEGILPICSVCKKIRDPQNHWQPIESYIRDRSDAEFSHGICPECAQKLYPDHNPYRKKN